MPDDDRLPRSLSGRWRCVLKAFQAGEPYEEDPEPWQRLTCEFPGLVDVTSADEGGGRQALPFLRQGMGHRRACRAGYRPGTAWSRTVAL